jgi:hypothetical protein
MVSVSFHRSVDIDELFISHLSFLPSEPTSNHTELSQRWSGSVPRYARWSGSVPRYAR